jgi:hypothetical protein
VRYRGALAFERSIDTTATEHAPVHVGPAGEPPAVSPRQDVELVVPAS